MNLLEVLKDEDVKSGRKWFRPVDDHQKGRAFIVVDGVTIQPVPERGELSISPFYHHLVGEWEIISPLTVIAEKRR